MPLETWQSHRLALVPVSPNLKAFVTKLSRGSHVDSLHNTFRFVQKAQVSLLGHMGAELAHGDRVRLACNGRTFDIQKIG